MRVVEIETKICSVCKIEKPVSEFYKRKDRKGNESYRNDCKECHSNRHKEYYEENKDSVKKKNKEYASNNKEKILQNKRDYYQNNKDVWENWKKNNPERYKENSKRANERRVADGRKKESDKKYYETHKDKFKKYAEENKDSINEKRRKRNKTSEGRKKKAESQKRYRENHRLEIKAKDAIKFKSEEYKIKDRERKQLLNELKKGSDITVEWLTDLYNSIVYCPLCGNEMSNNGNEPNGKHLDHIIPKNKKCGGKHMKDNVRIICKTCNIRRPKDGSDLKESFKEKLMKIK